MTLFFFFFFAWPAVIVGLCSFDHRPSARVAFCSCGMCISVVLVLGLHCASVFCVLCVMGVDVQPIAMERSLQSFVLVCFYTEETRGGEPSKGH